MQLLSTIIIAAIEALSRFTGSYGISIILFAVALKMLLLPVTLYGMRWQERFKLYFKKAKDEIAALDIANKAKRDDKILDIYQANGINLANQCKALLPLLIQIPVLVAFYRTMVGWDTIAATSFLWMQDLSRVDSLFELGFTLPWFGGSLNLLPFMLFTVNAGEVYLFRDANTTLKSYSLPLIFFLLFYPFPSSCMIFWVTLNIVHVFERAYFVARTKRAEAHFDGKEI